MNGSTPAFARADARRTKAARRPRGRGPAVHGDGARIFETFVKPARVDLLKLGAHYAMSSLFESYPDSTRIYSYSVENKDYRLKRSGKLRLAFGKARFTSEITQDSEMLIFGVLHFGDHNLHGGVGVFQSEDAYRELERRHTRGKIVLEP